MGLPYTDSNIDDRTPNINVVELKHTYYYFTFIKLKSKIIIVI